VDTTRDRIDHPGGWWRFRRSRSDRLLTGVAAGLAERWQVDPILVRLAFVVLTLAGGVGAAAYGVAWMSSDESPSETDDDRRAPPGRATSRAVAFSCLVAGILLVLRATGLWLGDPLVVPASVLALGTAVAWGGFGSTPTRRPAGRRSPVDYVFADGRVSAGRAIAGLILLVVGLLALAGQGGTLDDLRRAASAVGLALAGLTLAFGPVFGRLLQQVAEERRDRMRTEARAEVAAHLHDSVLQTLTMIQRGASDPARVTSLARRQERELRAWLYGDLDVFAPTTTLSRALDLLAADVEAVHAVQVEAVLVGDAHLDARVEALVAAVREAVVNAAKHAGTDRVAVYIEVGPAQVEAFVRDRGNGFDAAQVPVDRHGIRDSLHGRMLAVGGRAQVTSTPGSGTEVVLVLPFQPSTPAWSGG
jgi:signal transduction histidine kinase/phage shock protein PspC (stress-responsive transcriptional regulator)